MASIYQKKNIPGVYLQVFDESLVISSIAAINVGALLSSNIGEANKVINIGNETTLKNIFGAPTDANFDEWLNIARIWKYKVGTIGAQMKIVRPIGDGSINGALTVTSTEVVATSTPMLIENRDKVDTVTVVFDKGSDASTGVLKFVTAYPTDVKYKVALATATDFATADIYTGVSFLDNFDFSFIQ